MSADFRVRFHRAADHRHDEVRAREYGPRRTFRTAVSNVASAATDAVCRVVPGFVSFIAFCCPARR